MVSFSFMPPLRTRRMEQVMRETSSKATSTQFSRRCPHKSWVKNQLSAYLFPALDGRRRGNGTMAPCYFAWCAGWLPISLTFRRWSMSTTWPKRDNRVLSWCWNKPVCPLGFLEYLWNKIKMPLMRNSTQSWCLCLHSTWTPSPPRS